MKKITLLACLLVCTFLGNAKTLTTLVGDATNWSSNKEVTTKLNLTTSNVIDVKSNASQPILTFVTNGGLAIDPVAVDAGTAIEMPYEGTREDGNYYFVGWYLDPEFTNEFDSTLGITTNTTIYAKWKLVCTLRFESGESTSLMTVYAGTEISIPDAPKMDGYNFSGWYTDEELLIAFDFTKGITVDTTVYAKWTLPVAIYENNVVSTIAGGPEVTLFNNPFGIALDATGNMYVADTDNNVIRKITSEGEVSIFAGPSLGDVDGTGIEVQFNSPYGVATDTSGNVYVVDSGNYKIRKITPDGVVSTLAGSDIGYADGTGSEAMFGMPLGVATDADDNVYVTDLYFRNVRKISPAGVVTTIAGSTEGNIDPNSSLGAVAGIAIDAVNNVYVTDFAYHKITKITPAGVVSTLAGSAEGYNDGTTTEAMFRMPFGIAVDVAGYVYVADSNNNKIRKITPDGKVTTMAGSDVNYLDGAGTTAQFASPMGVTLDNRGNVFIADTSNNAIRKITIMDTELALAFESNSGTAVSSVIVIKGAPITTPASPTKEGSVFVGWYADRNLSIPFNFSAGITANTRVYAKWGASLGVDNFVKASAFTAYPNPFKESLKIQSPTQGDYSYAVYDMTGKLVFNGKGNGAVEDINTSNLSRGLYVLSVTSEGKTQNIKLVKE